jgi:hypothetical protein
LARDASDGEELGCTALPASTGCNMNAPALGSWHSGICFFLFADGAVRPLAVSISQTILQNLGYAKDGAVIDIEM